MFFGTHRLSLDDKNRMRLPAKFRAKIGDDFVLCQGTDGCLFVMSHNEFENFISKIDNVPLSEHEKQNAIRAITSRVYVPEEDSQGRFILPSELKRAAGIEKKVVFMGVRNRIEIWSEEYYHERFEKGFESIDQAIDSLREYGF
ncbi:MAG: division/cell wall cluster transcriptional repressor MraZ [Bacillota bacterium]|jgi:MraZ protein|nr:division/cell wall cluster transcriptional repressor MraZ [Bacillota bacterium]HHU43160.1 division/cell wall cluster transcriptional repressor MraZ [Clostridiales bacterium]